MNDNGALLVWSYLSSPFTFSNPYKFEPPTFPTSSSVALPYTFIPMGSHTKNGLNLDADDPSDDRKRKPSSASCSKRGAGGAAPPSCQVDDCPAVLTEAKRYHRRHKVCEFHAKAAVVVVAGVRQRFCQQCSRFHELSEFDEAKRSCRRRLAGHNERRRKGSSSEPQATDAAYKHFQIG